MRPIDADALKEKIEQCGGEGTIARYCKRVLAECLDNDAPTIDAVPVVHGRWVKMTGMMPPEYVGHYKCSVCQWHESHHSNIMEYKYQFCPNCGAKMDEKQENKK